MSNFMSNENATTIFSEYASAIKGKADSADVPSEMSAANLQTLKNTFSNNVPSGGASFHDVTDTLTAGSTTLTLYSAYITTNATYQVFSSVWGVCPTNVSVSTGSMTLTFDAQQADLAVKVRIWL